MKRYDLTPHPTAPAPTSLTVTAGAELVPDGTVLLLEYSLHGDLAQLALPRATAARRADRLWEHTCFEAFIAPAGFMRYWELNFSPSTEWAAYELDGYRAGMRPAELAGEAMVTVTARRRAFDVTASVVLGELAAASSHWRLGLTAVIEDAAGKKSYWALRHPRPTPDFHDAAGFILDLKGNTR